MSLFIFFISDPFVAFEISLLNYQHGTLQLSAKRTLNREHSLHFYDVPTREFNCMSFFSDFITMDSDRVNSALNVLTLPEKDTGCACCPDDSSAPCPKSGETKADLADARDETSVRSTIYVAKICCSSEVPAINAILNPIEGMHVFLLALVLLILLYTIARS